MDKIYAKEHQVLATAEKLLGSRQFESEADEENYRLLCEEYKKLLRQTIKVIQISDIMQLELKKMSKQLETASQLDSLTGLYNRKYFLDVYQREWKSAVRSGGMLTLLMADIDYFKEYNDTYGHIEGDSCLTMVTDKLRCVVNRPRDVIVRYGGDEFIIMLPETGIAGAAVLAEKILAGVQGLGLEHSGSQDYGKVTVSIGVAEILPKEGLSTDILLRQVDQALYEAKREGRNCFRLYSHS